MQLLTPRCMKPRTSASVGGHGCGSPPLTKKQNCQRLVAVGCGQFLFPWSDILSFALGFVMVEFCSSSLFRTAKPFLWVPIVHTTSTHSTTPTFQSSPIFLPPVVKPASSHLSSFIMSAVLLSRVFEIWATFHLWVFLWVSMARFLFYRSWAPVSVVDPSASDAAFKTASGLHCDGSGVLHAFWHTCGHICSILRMHLALQAATHLVVVW